MTVIALPGGSHVDVHWDKVKAPPGTYTFGYSVNGGVGENQDGDRGMTVTVARGTTFDSRAFAPYLKSAIPAQSGLLGSTVSLNAAFYIAGGTNPVWTATGLTALGLSINSIAPG